MYSIDQFIVVCESLKIDNTELIDCDYAMEGFRETVKSLWGKFIKALRAIARFLAIPFRAAIRFIQTQRRKKRMGDFHDVLKNPEKYTPEEFEAAAKKFFETGNSAATEEIIPGDIGNMYMKKVGAVAGRALNKAIDKVAPGTRETLSEYGREHYNNMTDENEKEEFRRRIKNSNDEDMSEIINKFMPQDFQSLMASIEEICTKHKLPILYKIVSPLCEYFGEQYDGMLKILRECMSSDVVINDDLKFDYEREIINIIDILDSHMDVINGITDKIPTGPDGKSHLGMLITCNLAFSALGEIKQWVATNVSKKTGKIGIDFCMAYAKTFTATAKANCLKDVEKLSQYVSKACDTVATILENAGTGKMTPEKQQTLTKTSSRITSVSNKLKGFCARFTQ